MFQTYLSKPSSISATQFTDENKDMVLNDMPGAEPVFLDFKPAILVKTIHGQETAIRIGDWVAKEQEPGKYYPINKSIFNEKYYLPEYLTLFIIRGLPGSGKSTIANMLVQNVIEADSFHIVDGVYKYDGTKAGEAHQWCYDQTRGIMGQKRSCAVANTFVKIEQFMPYIGLAKEMGFSFNVIDCHGKFENLHGVPENVIQKMADQWEIYTP